MFKKILPLLLAVAMIFSLGAVNAFAANDNDATLTGNKVTIGKTYKLENTGTTNPAETFYLVQTAKSVSNSSLTTAPDLVAISDAGYTGNDRLVGKISYTEGEATTVGERKDIEIELPAYDAVGIYTYTLREVDNGTPGVSYLQNDISLVVSVLINDEGKYYVAGVHCEENVGTDEKVDNFTNTFSATGGPDFDGLNVTKTVTGNLGEKDRYFDFTIEFFGDAGNYAPVTVSGGSFASNPTSVDLSRLGTIDAPGDDPATVTVSFKLKDGETIKFNNIPYGIAYFVTETDYSSAGYSTLYDGDEAGGIEGFVEDATPSHTVKNTKNGEIDTGVILDNLPYIMAIALVVLAGAAFIVSKKRRNAADKA